MLSAPHGRIDLGKLANPQGGYHVCLSYLIDTQTCKEFH